jgi:hypothetical protein
LDTDSDGKVDLRELICGFAILVDGSVDEKLLGIVFSILIMLVKYLK